MATTEEKLSEVLQRVFRYVRPHVRSFFHQGCPSEASFDATLDPWVERTHQVYTSTVDASIHTWTVVVRPLMGCA
jgi:hypothetical protein